MFRRFPHIAAASLVALTIGLSACSGSTPADQQTASQGSNTSETAQNSAAPTQNKEPDPDLASKILTGEVAGVTLKKVDKLPSQNQLYEGTDAQSEPSGCLDPGLKQLAAGSLATTQTGTVSVLLGSDATTPDNYKAYVQKCSSATITVSGSSFTQTIEMQQAPAIDGAANVIAARSSSEGEVRGQKVTTKLYLIMGNVNGSTVITQSMTLSGADPSPETASELFKAQVEKLKG